MQHPWQRVGVFVDVQNLYYSAKNLHNCYVNFAAILKTAVGQRQLIRAVAYGVRANLPKQEGFFKALEEAGFETKIKDLQTFPGGMQKGNWDAGMVVDILRLAPKLDVVVIVSGDGDFVDLIEYLQNHGIWTEVIAFGQSASSKLKQETDMFYDLDQNFKQYLLKKIS
ncbi:MAG: NYN domain-containing protein [Candidatus Berkelbacteria bacterium]|nr:NYN domain-containing protein [Candidatus Berkelbacteria bacterium]